ncbi:MAG: molybdenum cofactor biosynthesis protein B [Vicinamibacterales bacterium]
MSQQEHKAAAPGAVRLFVLTVSDTRTEATDTGGAAVVSLATAAGHVVTGRALVKDEPADVARMVTDALGREDVDAVITTGGTGLSPRDTTYEAIVGLLEKRLDGFGELFRMLSYQDIGPAAMLSRATAGTARGKFVAALPGSEGAVRLAMDKLIVPELGHIVQQLGPQRQG